MGPCCTFQLASDPHSLAAGPCLCGLSWKPLISSDSPSFVLCVTWLGSQQAPHKNAGAAWDRLLCEDRAAQVLEWVRQSHSTINKVL